MSYIDERVEEFRRWILKKDKLILNSTNSDKQFKLECKKSNLNCLSEFKKISELIIKWIKTPDALFNAGEIDVEYLNMYIKIVLDINDFNIELIPNIYKDNLEVEVEPLLYVVDFKLNIINSEILKREIKMKVKINKNESENK